MEHIIVYEVQGRTKQYPQRPVAANREISFAVQQGDGATHLRGLERRERLLMQLEQQIERATVIFERRGREAPLVLQRGEIVLGELSIHYSLAVTPAAQSSPMRRRYSVPMSG